MRDLPKPSCNLGYTHNELVEILGDRFVAFNAWIIGQTVGVCTGRRFNYDTQSYESTGCGPHGIVTYSVDVQTFLAGHNLLD